MNIVVVEILLWKAVPLLITSLYIFVMTQRCLGWRVLITACWTIYGLDFGDFFVKSEILWADRGDEQAFHWRWVSCIIDETVIVFWMVAKWTEKRLAGEKNFRMKKNFWTKWKKLLYMKKHFCTWKNTFAREKGDWHEKII